LFASGDVNDFWGNHSEIEISDEFKILFDEIFKCNPKERPSLNEIMNSPWVQGELPKEEEIQLEIQKIMVKKKNMNSYHKILRFTPL